MTQKVSLVMDEEQAIFVAHALLLAASVAHNRLGLIPDCVDGIIAMLKDGTVSIKTVDGLVENMETIAHVYCPRGPNDLF